MAERLEGRVFLSAAPQPDHIVVVIEENHSIGEVIGNPDMPYLNALAQQGVLFTNSQGLFHPSQPNYIALFAGSNLGVVDNALHDLGNASNLYTQLKAAGKSFIGYAEDLPEAGSKVFSYGKYDRRHVPWASFDNIPASSHQPFTSFPNDYSTLPTVSMVVPNEDHNSHDGPPADADQWLMENLEGYAAWAPSHNSLLIVTYDEGDPFIPDNHIPTVFYGAHALPGQFGKRMDHYNLLRTIEDLYGLPGLRNAANALPIDYGHRIAPPDLSSDSDSGIDRTDNVTNTPLLAFKGVAATGQTVRLFSDGVEVGSATADFTGAYSISVLGLTQGTHAITAAADVSGYLAYTSDAVMVTVDRTPPKVLQVRFNEQATSANVKRIGITFSELVNVAMPHLVVRNQATGVAVPLSKTAMSFSGLDNQAVWSFPGFNGGVLDNGNYTGTLSGSVTDLAGNLFDGNGDGFGGDPKSFSFFQLAADANVDRVVNGADMKMLVARLGMQGAGEPADFNGDGAVSFADFQILELNYGRALAAPAPASALPAAAAVKVEPKKPLAVRSPPFARRRVTILKDLLV